MERNRKGGMKYVLKERVMVRGGDLVEIFEREGIGRKKVKEELKVFMEGVGDVEK